MAIVSVPQTDGEITLASHGDAPTVYIVADGQASVPDEDVPRFLENVPGAVVVDEAGNGGRRSRRGATGVDATSGDTDTSSAT